MKFDEANSLLAILFDKSPHDFNDPKSITITQKEALARVYAEKDFRDYLTNSINKIIMSSALYSDDVESLMIRKGMLLTLKQLHDLSKSCYNDYMSLKKIAKK